MWRKRISNILVLMAIFTASTHAQYDQQPQQQIQIQQPQQPVFFQQPQQYQQQPEQPPSQQQQHQQQLFNPFQMFFRSQQNPTPTNLPPQLLQPENFPILSRLMSAFKNAFTRSPQPNQQQQQAAPQFFQQNQQQLQSGPMQPSNNVFQVVPAPPTTRRPNILDSFFG